MPSRQPRPILTFDPELARELAGRPQGLEVTCDGDSMAPTVRRGEKVTVRRVAVGELRAGDVILFEIPGAVELHRVIVRLPRGRIVHRGDAPGAMAGVVREDRVIGRAELPRRPPSAIDVVRAMLRVTKRVCTRSRATPRP